MSGERWALLARGLAECALLAVAPLLLLVIRYFSWGAGVYRLLCYALLFGFVFWACRRCRLQAVFEGRLRFVLWACALLLVAAHLRLFAVDIARGGRCLTDMGAPSICAGEWLRKGHNPWAECLPEAKLLESPQAGSAFADCVRGAGCIDRKAGGSYGDWTHHGAGFDFMDGYKYGPLMVLSYAPLAHTLRERGLSLINVAFWLAQCALLLLLARAAYPEQPSAGARALIGLCLPLAFPSERLFPPLDINSLGAVHRMTAPEHNTFVMELTQRCANDILPVTLLLLAVLLAARGRSRAAGVVLGLSLAQKLLPAALLCLLLPRLERVEPRSLLLAAAVTGVVCYLPALLWGPRELLANLLLFNLLRPTNSSSIRAYLPAALEPLVSLVQLALWLGLACWFGRARQRTLPRLILVTALVTIGFVALNKVVHGNYLLWLQPFVALALAGLPFQRRTA